MANTQALLIIDMQKGSFTPKMSRFDTIGVVNFINGPAKLFRQLDFPVIYIQHNGTGTGEFEINTQEWDLMDDIKLEQNDVLVDKYVNDVFYD